MNKNSTQIGYIMIALAAAVVVLIIYIYMFRTTNGALSESSAARKEVQNALANKSGQEAFMNAYTASADSWKKIPNLFISSDNYLTFIEAVESLGSHTGAATVISSINADNLENAAPGTLGNIQAHVDAKGTWGQVMQTLELAEILPFKATVSNVSLTTGDKTSGTNTAQGWDLNFDVKAVMIAVKSTK